MKKDSVSYRVLMLFCSNLILQLMGFAYRMALSRLVTASALGLNSLVMQLYGIVVSLSISGLNIALAAIAARKRPSEMRTLLKSGSILFAALWIVAALPLMLFSKTAARTALGDAALAPALVLMLFCIFMTGIENVLKSIHLGAGKVTVCAASELTEQAVRFLLVILLLNKAQHESDPKAVFLIMLGMVFSELVSVSFLSVSFCRQFPKSDKCMRPGFIKSIASVAFPAALTAVSSNLFSSAGTLLLPSCLIEYGLSRQEALSGLGIINTSTVPLAMLPMAFMGAIAAVVMPELSSRYAEGRETEKLVKKAFMIAGASGTASALLIFLFGRGAAERLFGAAPSYPIFFLVELRAFFIYIQAVSTAVLNGRMLQKTVLLTTVCSEVFGLVIMLLLTPVLGFAGFCGAAALSELMRLLLNITAIKKGMEKHPGI